jgi:hypothetical protein
VKYTIEIAEDGQITLKKNEEIVLISKRESRIADVLEDMLKNNGEIKNVPQPGSLFELFEF